MNENKCADQLHLYHSADLHLRFFAYTKRRVPHDMGHWIPCFYGTNQNFLGSIKISFLMCIWRT